MTDQQSLFTSCETTSDITCLGLTFKTDEARRTYFLTQLREKLEELHVKLRGVPFTDIEDTVRSLRSVEHWPMGEALHALAQQMQTHESSKDLLQRWKDVVGFPQSSMEEILRISDPPYYTACPNPFLGELFKYHASSQEDYHCEPFTKDVSEGKNNKLYKVHSYHTKVPFKAIIPYLEHYTRPGDIVLDAFSGSGMTGLAGQTTHRQVILCDLAPAASFISHHYNSLPPAPQLMQALSVLLEETKKACGWMYDVKHHANELGTLNYTIWSEVFFCPHCHHEIVFWNLEKKCPHCDVFLEKNELQRKLNMEGRTEQVPVHFYYTVGKERYHRPLNLSDQELLAHIDAQDIPVWYPTDLMMHRSPPWGDYYRAGYHQGYERVHHFYTKRNLWTLAWMWATVEKLHLPSFLKFVITSLLAMRCSLRMPYRTGGRSAGAINNLHIPSLIQEYNPIEVLRRKGKDFIEACWLAPQRKNVWVTTQSATSLKQLPEKSIDYIFVDPPFGNNIIYSELNFLWEAWLRTYSHPVQEAIVSTHQKKGLSEYEELMLGCFKEMYRLLKPGRWITIAFHNSANSIWNAIQQAILSAGFMVADVRILDKQQGSYKQVSSLGAVRQDLVISAYKSQVEERFKLQAGTEEGVWEFIRAHLQQLPLVVMKDEQVEMIAERQNYLLFDRMLAFHVQRGVTVPLSATEFYAGLIQRFPERDEMYFLPEQVAIYEKTRMIKQEVKQLELFITDEASAIQWLKRQLTHHPQTFQKLHPQFLKELGGWRKHEKPLELIELLEQNFLCYEGRETIPDQVYHHLTTSLKFRHLSKEDEKLRDVAKNCWYVPDPNQASDLEKLREKALLKEFGEYQSKELRPKKLKVFRLEAVRAGFKHCWQQQDYLSIVELAKRLPESLLQEDTKLLMWYTNALTRGGEKSNPL